MFLLGKLSMKKTLNYMIFLRFFTFLLISVIPFFGVAQTEQLEQQLQSAPDEKKAGIYNLLAETSLKQSPSKSIKYAEQALKLAKQFPDPNEEAKAHVNIGKAHATNNRHLPAIESFEASLAIYKKYEQKQGIAFSYSRIAGSYKQIGQYSKSIINYTQALEIYQKLGDKKGEAFLNANIGDAYNVQKKFKDAIVYYQKSLAISKSAKDNRAATLMLNKIGNAYSNFGDFDNALKFLKEGRNLAERNNYADLVSSLDGNIKVVEGNKQGKAQSSSKFDEEEDRKKKQKLDKAIADKERSLEEISKLSEENQIIALKYKAQRDELKLKKLEAAQKEKEVQLKNSQLKAKNAELAVKEAEVKQQQLMLYGAIAVGVLLLAFLVVSVVAYRNKKRDNILLAAQKQEIEEQNQELAKLSIVASETDNAIVLIEADGEIEWANEGFQRLMGYSLEEYMELNGSNIKEVSQDEYIQDLVESCFETKRSVVYESANIDKSGVKKWIQTTLTPILLDDGSIYKLVAIDSDITTIREQRDELEKKNFQITDSIDYAKRIQGAILPLKAQIAKAFPEHFVFFNPRDLVSGDFYWFHARDGKSCIAAVDCTGHGVPGAFMSLIGNNLLDQIIKKEGIMDPARVLQLLGLGVIETLKQNDPDTVVKDGMDMAFCTIDSEKKQLLFAGAHNPLYMVRDGELVQYKAAKISVGFNRLADSDTFTNTVIDIKKGDAFYIFSDGFVDQRGGPKNKKFYYPPFRQLIMDIQHLSMPEQRKVLKKTIMDWKGDNEQIDDMLIIGFKV